jgi:hypothetical protein
MPFPILKSFKSRFSQKIKALLIRVTLLYVFKLLGLKFKLIPDIQWVPNSYVFVCAHRDKTLHKKYPILYL